MRALSPQLPSKTYSVGVANAGRRLIVWRGANGSVTVRRHGCMTTFSDDGRWFWDGNQWQPAISKDGSWRWDGLQWRHTSSTGGSKSPIVFRLGPAISGGLAVFALLLAFVFLLAFFGSNSKREPYALGYLGATLVVLSGAVLLATPIAVRIARRRNLLAAASAGAVVLFLGTCGGGIALAAAYPTPSPSPTPGAGSRPLPTGAPRPSEASIPGMATASPMPSVRGTATPTQTPTATPTPTPTPTHTPTPAPAPTATPTPAPAADVCGAPRNPWGYNFCGRGGYITSPPSNFCAYFSPCVSTFWTATSGYVVQCVSGKWSHSGGVSGACSSNGGVARALYAGP